MKVVVVGAGKVGYYLSKTLLEHGHSPKLIDSDKSLCNKVANELDIPVICGDGTEIDVLESADIASCDALISVTGKDEDNLIACQLAKKRFGIAKTVAKVNNPKNKAVVAALGVDIPVSSTDNIVQMIEREVDTAAIKKLLSLNRGEATINEIELPENFKYHNKSLMEISFPDQAVIASIDRDGDIIIPRGNTLLKSKDKIIVIAKNTKLHEISECLGL